MNKIAAVVAFEFRRSFSKSRILWWTILAVFPVFIVGLIKFALSQETTPNVPREFWPSMFYLLIPMAICMLGTFLWTTPAVSVELERRSWAYLAVRPSGPEAVMFGKFLVAVVWTAMAAITGLTVCLIIAQPEDPWLTWWTNAALVCASCPAYGAAYLMLGTLFYKRAMVVGVAYTIVFEVAISLIPALINKLTVQYRLRALFVHWLEIPIEDSSMDLTPIFGDANPAGHLAILLIYTLVMLGAAMAVLRMMEFTSADEATT